MSSAIENPIDGGASALKVPAGTPAEMAIVGQVMKPTRVRYYALAWLTAAAALAYLCRHAISVPESSIRAELGLSIKQAGWLQGAFFWTYAILQVPGGWFAERRGTRRALTIFAVVWSVAMIAMGFAPVFWMLIAAQLVMGAAQAGMLPAAYNSVGHWLPISQRAFGCGMIAAGMQIGVILASVLTAQLIEPLGWRLIFILFALPGILWAAGFFTWFRDRPNQVAAVNASELALIVAGREEPKLRVEVKPSESKELLSMARSPVMWWLCGQQICRAAGASFFVSWLPTFLQTTRGVTVKDSGFMQGAILSAMLAGTILSGLLTDWIWRRTGNLRLSRAGVASGSLALCAFSFIGAWLAPNAGITIGMLASGGFFAALGGPCAFAAAIDIAGPRVPQVAGFINMCGNFAAAACPSLVAAMFQRNADWNQVLLMFAAIYLASTVCWLFVNPSKRIQ